MGCACEDGSRETFVGVILTVIDKATALAGLKKIEGKMPDAVLAPLLKRVEEASDDHFSLNVKILGGDMMISGDMFPQTKEWAVAHIGKPLRFTVTQLPKQGGMSVDVCEHGPTDRR